jgi:hypothetical protein
MKLTEQETLDLYGNYISPSLAADYLGAHNSKPPPQVGGTHYDTPIQPIEYIEANQLSFHEANVIKYITRWRSKNGLEDLRKAKWYLDRLISIEESK